MYRIICQECKRRETRSEYRGGNRQELLLALWGALEREDNALWKHMWERHDGKSEENMYDINME